MHEQACCCHEAANHQLSKAVAFWIIWIVSTGECSSLMNNLIQIHCSTHSVILNVTATQYTCSLNGICCPHWLVQWNHHYSHMCILVYSLWLPGYIDVIHTVLFILTKAGLFPDRIHTHTHTHTRDFYCFVVVCPSFYLHNCFSIEVDFLFWPFLYSIFLIPYEKYVVFPDWLWFVSLWICQKLHWNLLGILWHVTLYFKIVTLWSEENTCLF